MPYSPLCQLLKVRDSFVLEKDACKWRDKYTHANFSLFPVVAALSPDAVGVDLDDQVIELDDQVIELDNQDEVDNHDEDIYDEHGRRRLANKSRDYITALGFSESGHCETDFYRASAHNGLNGDLNQGAGGKDIFTCVR